MKPGRELDAQIADKVMNMKLVRFQEQGYHNDLVHGPNGMAGVADQVPFYSTDIAAAWKVVEKIKIKNRNIFHIDFYDGEWICGFEEINTDIKDETVTSSSAPHAICLLAMKIINSA